MSTTPTTPPITVNTPAVEIAAANAATQTTETPGQPRNADGTFAPPVVAAPVAPVVVEPSPENPVVTTDLGNGQYEVKYLTGESFKGTAAEILPKIGQAHVSTKLWAKNQVQAPPPPPVVEPPSRFANPEEQAVAEYTANLIAKTLGYPDAPTMQRALGHIQENTTDYASQAVTLQFQAAEPTFNATKDNSDKLIDVINQSGMGQAFDSAERPQQVQMLRQAHAYCIMNKIYDPKPSGAPQARVAPPPPPPPSGRTPTSAEALPENLRATLNDTPEQIKAKWEQAKAAGYQ